MKKLPIKPLDIPVIAFAVVITVIVGWAAFDRGSSSSHVIIRGPDRSWLFPLDAEERVSVPGFIGETMVRIHGGRAAIVSSPCGAQTCVAAGSLGKNGQWAACLPNRVFLLVEGTDGANDIDAAAY